jgi:transposase
VFKVDPVRLDYDELIELERRANAHTSTQRAARRAKVILLCAQGMALRQIAEHVGMDQHQVGLWRKRFLADRLDGLQDQARSGRPRRLGHDERMQIAAVATSERDADDPIATWTYDEVAEAVNEAGIEVSVSQVWRILHAMDIDLSKVRGRPRVPTASAPPPVSPSACWSSASGSSSSPRCGAARPPTSPDRTFPFQDTGTASGGAGVVFGSASGRARVAAGGPSMA